VSLEEKEFRLLDIKTQVQTIFHKQVLEGNINFGVKFIGTESDYENVEDAGTKLPALGPQGTGRLKDMCLWGDQHRILQVIINLVSNSLKFTPEGGKVEVRIRCLGEAESISDGSRNSIGSKPNSHRTSRSRNQFESGSNISQVSRKPSNSTHNKSPGGTALLINPMDPNATPRVVREREPTPPPTNARSLMFQFEVEDSGPGIPPAMRHRVFEPFVQGDLGLSRKYGGTGLGLSICSQLAKLMGGDISLDSTEGVGSTFTMHIPLKHTKSRAASTSSAATDSRPNSIHQNGDVVRVSSPKRSIDPSLEKDSQPRLVGLSQPFFASVAAPSPEKDANNQLAALNSVAASKEPGSRLRVLVAEDNLVNQEVVLRSVISNNDLPL
jgi:osomolarity two-component system sensor histidine kinase SLN1